MLGFKIEQPFLDFFQHKVLHFSLFFDDLFYPVVHFKDYSDLYHFGSSNEGFNSTLNIHRNVICVFGILPESVGILNDLFSEDLFNLLAL